MDGVRDAEGFDGAKVFPGICFARGCGLDASGRQYGSVAGDESPSVSGDLSDVPGEDELTGVGDERA